MPVQEQNPQRQSYTGTGLIDRLLRFAKGASPAWVASLAVGR